MTRSRFSTRFIRRRASIAGVVLSLGLIVPAGASADLLDDLGIAPVLNDPGAALNDPVGTVDNTAKGVTGTVENIVNPGGGGGGGGGNPPPPPPPPPTTPPPTQPPTTINPTPTSGPGGGSPSGGSNGGGSESRAERASGRNLASADGSGPALRRAELLRNSSNPGSREPEPESSSPVESLLSAAGNAVVAIAGSEIAGVLGLLLLGTAAALEIQRRRGRALHSSPARTIR